MMENGVGEKVTASATGALRANGSKMKISLVPPEMIIELASILHAGADKYAPFNWEKGLDPGELMDSMMRHYLALRSGEIMDGDLNCMHSSLLAWNALAFSTLMLRHPGFSKTFYSCIGGPNVAASVHLRESMDRISMVMGKWKVAEPEPAVEPAPEAGPVVVVHEPELEAIPNTEIEEPGMASYGP